MIDSWTAKKKKKKEKKRKKHELNGFTFHFGQSLD